jgi:hypothetical protein
VPADSGTHAHRRLGYDAWMPGDLKEVAAMIRAALGNAPDFDDCVRAALMIEELAWITAAESDHGLAGCAAAG